MKFKSSHRINQRIERISTHHLIIGIDIAKETHVVAAVNFRGIQQGRILSFQNDAYGLKKLARFRRSSLVPSPRVTISSILLLLYANKDVR
jgi:transposase